MKMVTSSLIFMIKCRRQQQLKDDDHDLDAEIKIIATPSSTRGKKEREK